jgi:formate dehydrogenase iron-sulfur subunit
MQNGSLCGLGGLIPFAVLSAVKHFPDDFGIEHVEELNLTY